MIQQLDLDFTTASPINKEKFSRQNKQIYEHLAKGNTINIFEAIHMGIFHLHSRIAEIRNKHGVFLYDRMIKREGVDCKEYSLKAFEKQAA